MYSVSIISIDNIISWFKILLKYAIVKCYTDILYRKNCDMLRKITGPYEK